MKIERGVLMPPAQQGGTKYPFREMQVGDSLFIPLKDLGDHAARNLAHASRAYGKRHDMRFEGRIREDGYRLWRVE